MNSTFAPPADRPSDPSTGSAYPPDPPPFARPPIAAGPGISASGNGAPAARADSSHRVAWGLVALLVAGLAAGGYWYFSRPATPTLAAAGPGSMFYAVAPTDLEVKITKDGELQAVNNIDVVCQVEGLNSITELVKEGASVKKGEVLVKMDSSAIAVKIDDATLELQRARNDAVTAREMKEIQESQNSANLEAAKVARDLALLDLESYTKGIFPQQLQDAQTTEAMAVVSLTNTKNDLEETTKLFGKGFVTAADVKRGELQVMVADNALKKASNALKVLIDYQSKMDSASKRSAVAQAEEKLAHTEKENASNLAQKSSDYQQKQQSLALLERRLAHLKEQLEFCTIKAPADGLVVYASSNDRSAQAPIQEGATVREKQSLLRLPDTRSMKAVIRIGEGMVSRLRVNPEDPMRAMVKVVGVPKPIGATVTKISVLADSSQRWWNPDLKEYPVDLELDDTPENLKPGVGVQAELFVERLRDVLAAPLDSIYSAGPDSYVFARDGQEVRPVKVKIGQSNETHVQIAQGLRPDAQVLRLQIGQGRALLEKAGIKVSAATRPTDGKGKHKPSVTAGVDAGKGHI